MRLRAPGPPRYATRGNLSVSRPGREKGKTLPMAGLMRDSRAMEEVVQGSGLDWTIARPPRLTQEQYTSYRSREDAAPRKGFTLSRKAVAAFMLDAIDQRKHFRKVVGIAK